MATSIRTIESWGRLDRAPHSVISLDRTAPVLPDRIGLLPMGMGRSYGDVGLNAQGALLDLPAHDRFVSFDAATGRLRAKAGVTLGQIQAAVLAQGWLLPVTPGTQFVSLGGAIANDVHGKNHSTMGTFGAHVTYIDLLRSKEGPVRCSTSENPELFAATIGGLGLTGAVVEVGLQLRPVTSAWLDTETIPFEGLDAFFELSAASAPEWEYIVSWVDCARAGTPRGLLFRANHASDDAPVKQRRRKSFPVTPPASLINRMSVAVFNRAYYRNNASKAGKARQDIWSFFYPLDAVQHWNRIYGPKGFYQYQSVVPLDVAQDATTEMIDRIRASGQGSCLMVLKTFGTRTSPGLLSFPMPGVTFAMDFANGGQMTHDLMARLDEIVMSAAGRLYPAKDARMSARMFAQGYPNLDAFLHWRDPAFCSNMSKRLLGIT